MSVQPSPPGVDPAAGPAPSAGSGPGWPVTLLRVVVILTMLSVLAQSVFAGRFLSGDFDSLAMHQINGMICALLGLVTIIAAVLAVRLCKAPTALIPMSVIVLVAIAGEIVLGFTRLLALHIPLGTLLLVGVFRVTQIAWSRNASAA